jgi:hypothetical protein
VALLGLKERGVEVNSISELVRKIFEAGVASLIEQGVKVPSVEEAIELLVTFKTTLNPNGRGFKSLGLKISLEREGAEGKYWEETSEDNKYVEIFAEKEKERVRKLKDLLNFDTDCIEVKKKGGKE